MASRKQVTAERFGIEDNGKQAGATSDYKSLAAACKRCNKDIANGLAYGNFAIDALKRSELIW